MGRDLLLMLVLLCTIIGYIAFQNHRVSSAENRAEAAGANATRLEAELREARASVRIVTRFVDRVRIVRERGATITREIPVYVTPKADARCAVPAGFVSVHNAAAENVPLDQPAGDPDAPAPGITLSAVASTVAGNYQLCHETTEQLSGLQDYVRALQEIPRP